MLKRLIAFVLVLSMAVPFAACSEENAFDLTFTSDGSDRLEYIFYTDERVVYVIGGLMMVKLDGEPQMLEMALASGKISIEEIIAQAEADHEDGDLDAVTYPDGSCEYVFDGFKMIVLNTHLGNIDVYFTPSDKSYYDIQQR
jgi:hypothetical protein